MPPGLILLLIFLGAFALWIGPKIATLTSPQAQAIFKNIISTLQYMSLGFSLHLAWPPGLLRFFSFVKSLTDGINLAAPECVATNWSYYVYVDVLMIGLGALFGLAFVMVLVFHLALVAVRPPPPGTVSPPRSGLLARLFPTGDANKAALGRVHVAFKRKAAIEGFLAFGTTVAYLYLVNVLSQAFDCYESPDGRKLLADPNSAFRRASRDKSCVAHVPSPIPG